MTRSGARVSSCDVEVAVDIDGVTVPAGLARISRRRGAVTTDFTYDAAYLATPGAYPIDPGISFDARQVVIPGLPRSFTDAAPDRWGRRLIERRIRAEEGTAEARAARDVWDLDYLLGVSDRTRQGALRFRLRGQAEYAHRANEVPRLIRLPELLRAADHVARDDDHAAIKLLLDAGTGTLGGARPKASVVGDDQQLWIAKFPHHGDGWDLMAWEKTALDLAERAGIVVPDRVLTRVDERSVLLLRRFDREQGRRIGYVSAMTLLGAGDGDQRDYLDVASELSEVSSAPEEDLRDLWRRVALSVAIHNTDDHLRNHGVLRRGSGWRLSPVFDVNPDPEVAAGRATAIENATDVDDEVEGLADLARSVGLRDTDASRILRDVLGATEGWRSAATANGITRAELGCFEGAFEHQRAGLTSLAVSLAGAGR